MTGIWPPEVVYPAAAQCPHCRGVFTYYPGDVLVREGTTQAVPCYYCGRDVPAAAHEPEVRR